MPENEKNQEEDRSLFSQIFEKILQGFSIKFDDLTEESNISQEILLDGTPDSVLIISSEGEILRANHSFFLSFGYDKPAIIGKFIYRFLTEEFRESFRAKLRKLEEERIDTKLPSQDDIITFYGIKNNGDVVTSYCLLSNIQYNNKLAYIALIRDLGFDKTLFRKQSETNDLYTALTEALNETILWLDKDYNIVFTNSGVKTTFGWDREELIGKHFSILFPPSSFENQKSIFDKYLYIDDQDRKTFGLKNVIEFLGQTRQRGVAAMEMSFGSSKVQNDRVISCIIRDTTQRKTLERRLKYLAFHDKLTGLGNRDLYIDDITAYFKDENIQQSQRAAVLYIDLDSFKSINDPLGHNIGDEILIETARRLRVSLREGDNAYRFGSDKFLVFLPFIKDTEDAVIISKRILSSMAQIFIIKTASSQELVHLTVSIGIALIPEHGNCQEEITKNADIAMYSSKETGKNRYTIFNQEISKKAIDKWNMEQELRQALIEGGFYLVYQPIVNISSQIKGFEALARWKKKDNTIIPPSVFIPLAEESGLISELGDWILRRACYDMRRLREKGAIGNYVSVNVSSHQFMQSDYAKKLESIVKASELPPSWLKLELTESSIMHDTEGAIKQIKDIKKRLPGITFMIDDFGTGYSSLAYLARLPVDYLKIDISFVAKLAEKQNEKVVKAILNLANTLDLSVVVEGIESSIQKEYFVSCCDVDMQGFYFYQPLSYEDTEKTLAKSKSLVAKAKEKREKTITIKKISSLSEKVEYLRKTGLLRPTSVQLNS